MAVEKTIFQYTLKAYDGIPKEASVSVIPATETEKRFKAAAGYHFLGWRSAVDKTMLDELDHQSKDIRMISTSPTAMPQFLAACRRYYTESFQRTKDNFELSKDAWYAQIEAMDQLERQHTT